MKTHSFVVPAVIILLFISTLIFAEQPPIQRWVSQYNATATSYNADVHGLAIDNSGNVYVTCYDSNAAGADYTTVKYDPNGNQLWVAHYNGDTGVHDGARAIKADNSGNVYVTGTSTSSSTGQDYLTIKYGPNGNQLWAARYDFANKSDLAYAMAVDNSGNVYVTGESGGGSSGQDYATIKYGPNGNKLWEARYAAPGGDYDGARAIAVDNSGYVYVTGSSYGGSSRYDYATIKYNPNGEQLWAARYNGPGKQTDDAKAVAVDNNGNIYVTGTSDGGSATLDDYATIKYDPNGNQKWVARYNGPANSYDWAEALTIDNSGNIYVTGASTGIGTGFDYATIKYDPNGIRKWTARYNGPANGDDRAFGIKTDNFGNVYVTGYSTGTGTGADFVTIKYDSSGNQLWVVRYNSPENSNDYAYDLAIDNFGNLYAAGYCAAAAGTSYKYATIKYTQHSYCTAALPADMNGNCKVDFIDYGTLAKNWLAGKDWNDLTALADNWLECNFALAQDCW